MAAISLSAAEIPDLSATIDGLERHYNNPQTLQLTFQQTYTAPGRRAMVESGEVFLRKPRRMRWNYDEPPGKLFVSDGKFVYFYSPSANRVEKSPLRESGDLRTPLAFLIGRVDLQRDFNRFVHRAEGDDIHIVAEPRSDKSPYSEVVFLVTPDYRIRQLEIHGQDQSVMKFVFTDEIVNPALPDDMFAFQVPEGAELVEINDDETGDPAE